MIDPLALTFAFLGTIGLVALGIVKFGLKPRIIIREGKPARRR